MYGYRIGYNLFNGAKVQQGPSLNQPEEPEWDYEGIMTVGEGGAGVGFHTSLGIGSMNPSAPTVNGYSEIKVILWENYRGNLYVTDGSSGNQVCNAIQIDGVLFENPIGVDFGVIDNPFPSGGQECTIKIR